MSPYPEKWNHTVVRTYDDGFPLLMPKWGYALSAFMLFLIGFFGFFLNLMVILLMFKDRQLWTPLNVILFNLVCSDFFVAVLGNPLTLVSALFHGWVFGDTMCVLYGFFMALFGIASITTLTVLSFERYIMVTRPLSTRHLSTKGAIASIVFIWIYSLALTTPPLMGWGNYVNEAANISCSVNWHEQSFNTLTYILFLFAMGQVVPLAIITFSYANIVRTMKKHSERLGRVSRAETKVTVMVFVMIIAFTVAWTPYSIFALMEQFATEGIVSAGACVIPALVAKSSICYDPLIYVGMNTQFRQSMKKIFGMHSKGGLTQTERVNDNTRMSPTPRFSNDTTRYNTTHTTAYEDNRMDKSFAELSTIKENKTLEAEGLGETVCAEESSCSELRVNMLDDEKSNTRYSDADRLVLIERSEGDKDKETNGIVYNAYGNDAFEEHSTDAINQGTEDINNEKEKMNLKKMKHSFSLDLGNVTYETKKRKLCVEV